MSSVFRRKPRAGFWKSSHHEVLLFFEGSGSTPGPSPLKPAIIASSGNSPNCPASLDKLAERVRVQVLELALSDLQSFPSPAVQSILQGIETRLAATGEPGERVAILREGLRTLLELRDDPHFNALLENQRSVCTRVQDQGPVLRIGSTFLRKRQST